MKKTFREKLIVKFTGIARAHRSMKYPCLTVVAVVLFFYHILMHFVNNGKRYASVVFVAIFFMSSCSFSFAVFAERTGFISTQETYSAIVEDSDITLAEQPVNPQEQIILEENTAVSECETEEDSEEMVAYSLDDLLAHREGEAYQAPSTDIEDTGEEYVFSSSDWRLVLINKQHPIPEEYDFTLGTFTAGMRCDERIIEDLLLMMQAAKADGVNLEVCSPYRGDNRQEYLFNRKIKKYMGHGMSYMEAYKLASQTVTVPGASEHQVGLALDIWSDTYKTLDKGFEDTEAGRWLAEHSCEYGFILRYPEGKEYITSIEYEPWHFRYVGREAAMTMKQENICLEEFWDKYL